VVIAPPPPASRVELAGERYLVVSLGSIGRRHIANLRCLRPTSQIAVLRTSLRDLEGVTLPEGATHQFCDIEQAVSFAPRAAIIASPSSMHLEIASALVSAGIAVLVEKPLADTSAGLRNFVDFALQRRAVAVVGYNLRFLPSLGEARAMLQAGAIGAVLSVRAEVGQYLPDWRPNTRYQESVSAQKALGGGALLELSHELDYLFWIFGLPDTVMAHGGRLSTLELDVEDTVELCLEYSKPRRLVNVHLDFLQRVPHRSCRFIGAQGTLVWNALNDSIDVFTVATGKWEHLDFPMKDRNQLYLDELTEFLSLSDSKETRLPNLAEGYDVLAIVEAAKQSIASKQVVKVQGYGHI